MRNILRSTNVVAFAQKKTDLTRLSLVPKEEMMMVLKMMSLNNRMNSSLKF
jgi:hypothetical protein